MAAPAINFGVLATGALGFTVALAWNEAVSRAVTGAFRPRDEKAAAHATLVYAILVTLLVIVVAWAMNHTRRLVDRVRNGGAPPAGPSAGPGAAGPDCDLCRSCAPCYPQPAVRL